MAWADSWQGILSAGLLVRRRSARRVLLTPAQQGLAHRKMQSALATELRKWAMTSVFPKEKSLP